MIDKPVLSIFRRYGRALTRSEYDVYHDRQMRRVRARNYRRGRKAAQLRAQVLASTQ